MSSTSGNSVPPRPPSYQPLALCAAAAMLGITVDRCVPHPPFPVACWTFLAVAALLGWFVCGKNDRTASLLLLGAVAALFGLRHHLWFDRFDSRDIGFFATPAPAPAAVEGTVLEMPRLLPPPESTAGFLFGPTESTRFLLRAERIRDADRWTATAGRLEVLIDGNRTDLRIGDRVRLLGQLAAFRGPSNPDDPDRRLARRARRVLAQMRLPSVHSVERLREGDFFVARTLETIRRGAHGAFQDNMNAHAAPLASAMILGIREHIEEDTQRMLRETGTIHILAISGLHVGLLAVLVGWGLRLLGAPRSVTAVTLIGATLIYLFLTDVRPPAIRASTLVIVASTALFFRRRIISVNSLALTALIVLAINPEELFQFGAQLSFIGTGAFLWKPPVPFHRLPALVFQAFRAERPAEAAKNPPETEIPTGDTGTRTPGVESVVRNAETTRPANGGLVAFFVRKCATGLAELLGINVLIWLALMPLLMERIHLFTPVAVLLNPLLWPSLACSLVAGFGVLLGAALDAATGLHCAPYCGAVADAAFGSLLALVGFFHDLPYGYGWTAGPPHWWNVVFYPPLVLFTLVPGLCPRPRVLLAAISVWILVGVAFGYVRDGNRLLHDRLTLDVCAVGHGLAVLVIAPDGSTTVCDAGSLTSPYTSANVLARRLWKHGKTRIDRLILSHPDSDHYNGATVLAERFAIGEVIVPPGMFEKCNKQIDLLKTVLEERHIPLRFADRTTEINLGGQGPGSRGWWKKHGPTAAFLHPEKGFAAEMERESNAASLVLLIEHRGVRVLLPGDLDTPTRPAFLFDPPVDLDVMLLPHHGGDSRMTDPLIAWGGPEHLVISGGSFPRNADLLEWIASEDFTLHDTFEDGMVSIRIDTSGMQVVDFAQGGEAATGTTTRRRNIESTRVCFMPELWHGVMVTRNMVHRRNIRFGNSFRGTLARNGSFCIFQPAHVPRVARFTAFRFGGS